MSKLVVPQVFGIGFGRTGTTSLHEAFNSLGYNSIHFPQTISALLPRRYDHAKYNAATDLTVAMWYKHLHVMYPEARFVLTMRPLHDWLASMKTHMTVGKGRNGHLNKRVRCIREIAYGAPVFNEKIYAESYKRHQRDVLNYFVNINAPQLLVLDITNSDNNTMSELGAFLGFDIPPQPFPHKNSRVYNRKKPKKRYGISFKASAN